MYLMEEGVNWKKGFEIFIGLIIVFVIIMVVFGVLHFGFNFLKNSMSGNIISQEVADSFDNFNWIIVSILTAVIVVALLKDLVRRDIFKVNWD